MTATNKQPGISASARDFLTSVVPWNSGGYVTVHWKHPGAKRFHGRSCQTVDALLQWVAQIKAGVPADIYFCTSSQRLNSGNRSRKNALTLHAAWVDVDIDPNDPNKYATLAEAIASLFWCCNHLGIPRPSFLVASGGGLHAYWISDRALTVEEWQPFADALKAAFKNAGLKFDAGVTGDAARVLRVPGTFNYKYDDGPRRVRLLQSAMHNFCNGTRHDFAAVFGKILLEAKPLDDGIGFDKTPLPVEPILAECGWLREAYETGGKAFDNPQWNLTNLIATFLENGHELAHRFGNQHPDYDVQETDGEWKRKNRERQEKDIGWPQCKTIEAAGSTHCKTCRHLAEGKSPLNLARQQDPPPKAGAKLPLIVELGTKLWGAPTPIGKEYRFGADQSKGIDPVKGTWFDFATNKGGHIRDLMKKVAAAANREQPNADDVVVIRAADVVMRPLDWIWEGHLLRGSQELMSGLPDLSKSTVQINYIACATARLPWPDGAPAIDPMNVVMLTAEDTLEQIVVPRLRAAGADLNRVSFLKCIKTDEHDHDRQFLLAEDLDRLESLVKKIGEVGLITIDPITAYMGGRMDSHKATEVRAQLGPLKDFAERTNIAISTITHPPKAAGQSALNHFIGSQAFIAACRVGHLCIAEMEENEAGEGITTGRILFTNVRNTAYRQRMPTLAYRKKEVDVERAGQDLGSRKITAPQIVWEGPVDITADAAVAAASGKKPDQQPKVQAFLRELLKDGKPVPYEEIEAAAVAKGFTDKQMRTAKEKLGVQAEKEPGKMDGKWLWQLPNPGEGKYYY